MKLNRITIGYLASLGVLVNTNGNGVTSIHRVTEPNLAATAYQLSFLPPTLKDDGHARDIFRETPSISNLDVASGAISKEMQDIILNDCQTIMKAMIASNPKKFNTMRNVGHARYIINYTDGRKTHRDGSPFYDIAIFSNQAAYNKAIEILLGDGFIQTN